MSTRDYAASVLDTMNDEQLLDFLRLFADDMTLALAESELVASGAKRKRYSSFSEILSELEQEDDGK